MEKFIIVRMVSEKEQARWRVISLPGFKTNSSICVSASEIMLSNFDLIVDGIILINVLLVVEIDIVLTTRAALLIFHQ